MVYSLHLTFGLLVLPEFAPFSHAAYVEAKLVDMGMYSQIWSDFYSQQNGHKRNPSLHPSYMFTAA